LELKRNRTEKINVCKEKEYCRRTSFWDADYSAMHEAIPGFGIALTRLEPLLLQNKAFKVCQTKTIFAYGFIPNFS